MKPLCLLVAMLACSPIAAAAQTPPTPPAPPAAIPVSPPMLPEVPVLAAPVFDTLDLDLANLDLELAKLDIEGITRHALQEIDVEAIKQNVEKMKDDAKIQSKDIARQAREAARQSLEMRDFTFQLKGPGAMVVGPFGRAGQYDGGLSALQRRQYDQAISRFDEVITQKAPRADGALYWKAYSLYKLGRTEDALAAIAELRRTYAQSRYLNDARVLEADARQSSGKPLTGDADNDEIKLLAIQALQHSNPEGAVPLLESVLKATNSLQVKKRALFVLAGNDQPAAHQLLVSYAKGAGNPDLQVEAIRYLMARGKQTTDLELQEVYNSTEDASVKRTVIGVLASQDNADALVALARKETNKDLKLQIVRQLTGLASKNKAAMDYLAELIK